jgi:hypothetical protein
MRSLIDMNQTFVCSPAFLLATLVFLLSTLARAQSSTLTVAAFDGKSGKPLSAQRLLVFVGSTREDVFSHKHSLNVTAGNDGLATLSIDDRDEWLQVFVDFKTLCQARPNTSSFSVKEVVAQGLSSPNTCGSFKQEPRPNRLSVYARSPTLEEKMAR